MPRSNEAVSSVCYVMWITVQLRVLYVWYVSVHTPYIVRIVQK